MYAFHRSDVSLAGRYRKPVPERCGQKSGLRAPAESSYNGRGNKVAADLLG
jgi:hypothetical protein